MLYFCVNGGILFEHSANSIFTSSLGANRSCLMFWRPPLSVVLFSGLLAFGVKESAMVNKVFTCVNVLVLVFVVIAGFIKGSLKNWNLNPEEILNRSLSEK